MAEENFKTQEEVQAYADLVKKSWFSDDPTVRLYPDLHGSSEGDDWTLMVSIRLEALTDHAVMSSGIITQMRLFGPADERGHVIYLAVGSVKHAYHKGIERGRGLALNTITSNLTTLIFPNGIR